MLLLGVLRMSCLLRVWDIYCKSAFRSHRFADQLLIVGSMLGVMTMNVGYFLAVLAGIWLGTFILGGAAADNQWAHC